MSDAQPASDANATPDPTRADRWIVLLGMSVAVTGSYDAFDYTRPMAPVLSRQLGFSDSQIGLVVAAMTVGRCSSSRSFANGVQVTSGSGHSRRGLCRT
jgi:hypothetical protein